MLATADLSGANGHELQAKAHQLRSALHHWQVWDAEYEALKEEVEAVSDDSSQADKLRGIHQGFEGEFLRGKELDEIFGQQQGRTRSQIISTLQRRVDYVSKNIQDLQRQLSAAERNEAVVEDAKQSGVTDADDQPITDIVEVLDDHDNVVSYQLKRPGDSVSRITEALEKTGLGNAIDGSAASEKPAAASASSRPQVKTNKFLPRAPARPAQPLAQGPVPSKKTIAFVDDDAPAPEASASSEMSRPAKRVKRIMETAKEQESISNEEPVIPDNEDAHDAALRQEMLRYGMGEVGAVVAELELEEGATDEDGSDAYHADEYNDDDDYSDDEDEDEDAEDRFGRSISRLVTDEYRQRMLELEKKLGVKSRFTQAAAQDADADEEEDEEHDQGIGRILVKHGSQDLACASRREPSKSSLKANQGSKGDADKKGVRFAPSLDIAPEHQDGATPANGKDEPLVEPLSDIVERPVLSGETSHAQARETKSRFKLAIRDGPPGQEVPKSFLEAPARLHHQDVRHGPPGPEGVTLANELVEREPASEAVPPSHVENAVSHGALAAEHQRLRNRFIQRQGGYLEPEEQAVEIVDQETGEAPAMSRFKAARLSHQ
ncbi:hypothetical protein CDD81_6104 [Ophiocordyceps australis]|uniref:DUF3835 domain-containing protein n=1 Tax=Ophiocordyceps australis TaxID=1399860 RepID=A0A2C5Y7B1_9HYPO|nr:hypothetical protein CDD81_6104 [Ophiocordyceps australis]